MFIERLKQIWKIPDLRKNILFILSMLIIFRLANHIPIPGVDAVALRDFFRSNQFLGMLNIFSGGGMDKFSIMMLGIAPYITAAIIIELLTVIVPKLEELTKEGESGYQKINQYTRLLTIPLAIIQSIGMITLLKQSSRQIIGPMGTLQLVTIILTVTAGTIFIMWIGELITEKKLGNGISLLIFAGIVAHIPEAIKQTYILYGDTNSMNVGVVAKIIVILVLMLALIAAIIAITEGYRKISISYARQIRGDKNYGGMDSHLPIKVNQAGMIPIIFAVSIIYFPPMVAQFLIRSRHDILVRAANLTVSLFQNQLFHGILFFSLVVGFTYFYSAIVFHPDQIAENLQRQGAFIPGVRPGKPTAEYIDRINSRIMFSGALSLALIAVLPMFFQSFMEMNTLTMNGASLLIVVGVVIEIMEAVNAQLTMRAYEEF